MTPREIRFAQHITELAAAFKVRLLVRQGMPPERAGAGFLACDADKPVHARRRCVTIAPVVCEVTYAIALHELGHCLSPLGMLNCTEGSDGMRRTNSFQSLRDVRLCLEEEQAAWEWARHYALEWTDVMSFVEKAAYDTYKRDARRYGVK